MGRLDAQVPYTGGRSVRELIILAGGVALCVGTCAQGYVSGHIDWGNLAVYVGATLAFGLRFFLARAIGVGACVGAIVQQWPHLRRGLEYADVETLAILPLVGILLLASRDLTARFDRAPMALPGVANPWAAFSLAQTRTIRWSCYAAGALAGLLDHTTQLSRLASPPIWPRAAMVAIILSIGLLGLGRAVGLLGVWAAGLVVMVLVAPYVPIAEQALAGDLGARAGLYTAGAHYVLPVFLLAAAVVLIAAPFTLRLLRRTLVG